MAWLRPPSRDDDAKLSKSDIEKRTEIFLEFAYWLFDSFLIPLVRTNFHVTESNAHRNRLFYFRHDVWRMLTEPALVELRMNMFEEMPSESTERLLSARQLGFSNIRLLPKKQGFRTIMNLKRRQQVMRNGTMILGRSINSVMTPAFNAITYEKVSVLLELTGFLGLIRCSHCDQINSAALFSLSEICIPSLHLSKRRCDNEASATLGFTLPKLTYKLASILYHSHACCV
jgi:hypothetical protein